MFRLVLISLNNCRLLNLGAVWAVYFCLVGYIYLFTCLFIWLFCFGSWLLFVPSMMTDLEKYFKSWLTSKPSLVGNVQSFLLLKKQVVTGLKISPRPRDDFSSSHIVLSLSWQYSFQYSLTALQVKNVRLQAKTLKSLGCLLMQSFVSLQRLHRQESLHV